MQRVRIGRRQLRRSHCANTLDIPPVFTTLLPLNGSYELNLSHSTVCHRSVLLGTDTYLAYAERALA